MLNQIMQDILTLTQVLLIPAMVVLYKSLKKQINNQRDIKELKVYTKAICKELKLVCTLDTD